MRHPWRIPASPPASTLTLGALPIAIAACLLAAYPALAAALAASDAQIAQIAWTVEPAADWTALFDTDSGWSGADGIFSIPLTGPDVPVDDPARRTLFVFSDTFIGDVGPDGERLPGTVMVNNTGALLQGPHPAPQDIRFLYRTLADGTPASLLVPQTPEASSGDWYWLGDGVVIDGVLHVFAHRMKTGGGGDFNFATDGVAIASLPVAAVAGAAGADAAAAGAAAAAVRPTQVDAPLFVPADSTRGEIVFGGAILDNTAEAGAPAPDGYVYVYGAQNDPLVKKLVAARVRPQTFLDFSTWEFLGAGGWTADIAQVAPLANRISPELSITPFPDGSGRCLLVYQEDTLGRYVAMRVGAGPTGPWGPSRRIYTCPEPDLDPDVYTYNAKAHPHLSGPGELLISYNVNTFDFWDHFRVADIYRPRFIRLRFAPAPALREAPDAAAGIVTDFASEGARDGGPADFALTARPNPFNPRTEVAFTLPAAAAVRLQVHDLAGRRVATLLDGDLAAGPHSYTWDGRDAGGRPAPAGVYLLRLQAGPQEQVLRVTLVK